MQRSAQEILRLSRAIEGVKEFLKGATGMLVTVAEYDAQYNKLKCARMFSKGRHPVYQDKEEGSSGEVDGDDQSEVEDGDQWERDYDDPE